MPWTWDKDKSRTNRRKHKLGFKTAQLVFADPLAASRPDPYRHEERWQTIGMIEGVIVIVIHTSLQMDHETGEETGRIISRSKGHTPREDTL